MKSDMPPRRDLMRLLESGGVVFDGAMGSMLIAKGLEAGRLPDEWNLTRPGDVADVHRAYRSAGADVVTTNTFGSTPSRLQHHGLSERTADVNRAGVALARVALDASAHRHVAVSLGPTGMMFPPMGAATEGAIAREFSAQLSSLDGGFDLVLIETMFDAREAMIALGTARACVTVPVAVSMTYNRTPRGFFTVMGDEAATTTRRLDEAGADVIACNCSIASADMLDLAPILRAATSRPILCQPNAGQPRMVGTAAAYDQAPETFAEEGARLFDLGANAVGGCCGTTPDFIRALVVTRGERR
jgi:methionine synthase I (cobalamin-dependent)